MLHACVRLGMGSPLCGLPAARLFLHLQHTAAAPLPDTPWSTVTASDVGHELPDGVYATFVRLRQSAASIHQGVMCVSAGIARLVVLVPPHLGDHLQCRGQVLIIMFAPVMLSARLPVSLPALWSMVDAWFKTRPAWWSYYIPHAMEVLQREWYTGVTPVVPDIRPDPLELLAAALGYTNPLPVHKTKTMMSVNDEVRTVNAAREPASFAQQWMPKNDARVTNTNTNTNTNAVYHSIIASVIKT
jgi:hypothetical protein